MRDHKVKSVLGLALLLLSGLAAGCYYYDYDDYYRRSDGYYYRGYAYDGPYRDRYGNIVYRDRYGRYYYDYDRRDAWRYPRYSDRYAWRRDRDYYND